jgi:hypothetical protein
MVGGASTDRGSSQEHDIVTTRVSVFRLLTSSNKYSCSHVPHTETHGYGNVFANIYNIPSENT